MPRPTWFYACAIILLARRSNMARKLKLGFILHGVGRTWNDWRHPDRDVNASTNFPFYK